MNARPATPSAWFWLVIDRVIHFVGLLGMGLWMGGFAFYSAFVVPVMHDEFGTLDGANVTRGVTWWLNTIGVVVLTIWWVGTFFRRPRGWARFALPAMLLVSSLSLYGLFELHRFLVDYLENRGLTGFYTWHERYLILCTIQFFANITALAAWTFGDLSAWRPASVDLPPVAASPASE